MPISIEGAVNGHGQAAIMIPPQGFAPVQARVSRGRIDLSFSPGQPDAAFRVADEVSLAATRNGSLLVVEASGARVSRETQVPALPQGIVT